MYALRTYDRTRKRVSAVPFSVAERITDFILQMEVEEPELDYADRLAGIPLRVYDDESNVQDVVGAFILFADEESADYQIEYLVTDNPGLNPARENAIMRAIEQDAAYNLQMIADDNGGRWSIDDAEDAAAEAARSVFEDDVDVRESLRAAWDLDSDADMVLETVHVLIESIHDWKPEVY